MMSKSERRAATTSAAQQVSRCGEAFRRACLKRKPTGGIKAVVPPSFVQVISTWPKVAGIKHSEGLASEEKPSVASRLSCSQSSRESRLGSIQETRHSEAPTSKEDQSGVKVCTLN